MGAGGDGVVTEEDVRDKHDCEEDEKDGACRTGVDDGRADAAADDDNDETEEDDTDTTDCEEGDGDGETRTEEDDEDTEDDGISGEGTGAVDGEDGMLDKEDEDATVKTGKLGLTQETGARVDAGGEHMEADDDGEETDMDAAADEEADADGGHVKRKEAEDDEDEDVGDTVERSCDAWVCVQKLINRQGPDAFDST
jgi:hypothetical protein